MPRDGAQEEEDMFTDDTDATDFTDQKILFCSDPWHPVHPFNP